MKMIRPERLLLWTVCDLWVEPVHLSADHLLYQLIISYVPDWMGGDNGTVATHHPAIEVRQISFIEKAQGETLLGCLLFREPGVGHGTHLRQMRGQVGARNDLERHPVALRAAASLAQIGARGAL